MRANIFSKCGALFIVCLLAIPASAQMVIQADSAALQPHIRRDEAGFGSCGVRAVVVALMGKEVDAYDFSMSVGADNFYGLLKAGKTRVSLENLQRGKRPKDAVTPPPIKFWIAKEVEGKAVMPIKIMPAETKGFILEIADIVPTWDAILAMIHGERMQFAVRYKNEPLDVVVSFAANMSEVERKPLVTCLDAVLERLKNQAEEKSGK